ncbi:MULTISPECIES: hypothetical protein [unclassified Mesorhizobium]|uniref:hypothetical protein n=1 Tax=unclassified Mesorhizobium TaxID=325217 RepID=UPI000FD1CF49|nr:MULTISPECIES: hypothetical protein [unclassified Mesorhizobium]RVA05130.1 hypothetical protein EN938_10420 [Mesorhizobium sp. M7A.F.Ca.US.001.02.1.1]RVA10628.1 hypothetical protein EN932_18605 [Mesorhizobium sp. M7A.F.Ca.US.002.01.1.1]
MTVLFEPLNSDGHLRGLMYHDARLQMLHDRVINRMERVDHLANEVEQAAATLVDATRSSTVHAFPDDPLSNSSAAFLSSGSRATIGL